MGIVRTEGVLGGEPRLEGRRIGVLHVVDMVFDGESPEYVADQLDVSLGEVHTALAYYYDHPEEMRELRERHRELEDELAEIALSPPELEQ